MFLWVKDVSAMASVGLYNLIKYWRALMCLCLQTTLTIQMYGVGMFVNVFASVWVTLCFTVQLYKGVFV